MATSSIKHVFMVKDPKKAEAFIDSMEKAKKAPKFKHRVSVRYLTESEEIDKLMDAWRQKHKK